MEKSKIYSLIEEVALRIWRIQAERSFSQTTMQEETETKLLLEQALKNDESGSEVLNDYRMLIEQRKDYVCNILNERMLQVGIEIGFEFYEKIHGKNKD